MGAMARTFLGLLGLLLLAPAEGASEEEGEVCLVWLQGPIKGLLLFRCPQRPDGTDGRFCCGTCTKPYCCDFAEARMGQDGSQCWHAWRMLKVFISASLAQKEAEAMSIQQVLEASMLIPQPKTVPTDLLVGLVATVLKAALLILMCFWNCCPERCAPCLGLHQRRAIAPVDVLMVVCSDPRPPQPPCPRLETFDSFDSPPPYREIPPPPPYTQVAPSNHSQEEEGATVGLQRLALSGGGLEEAVTQSPTTSGATSAPGSTVEPATAGDITPELGVAGDITPELGVAGDITPELGVAVAGEVMPPVQEASCRNLPAGRKATAMWDPAGGGEGASHVMSSAPAVSSTQPAPVEETIPGSSRVGCEIKELEV